MYPEIAPISDGAVHVSETLPYAGFPEFHPVAGASEESVTGFVWLPAPLLELLRQAAGIIGGKP